MNEVAALSIGLLGGMGLGLFFFGGLWWTVLKGLASDRPALWFSGSMLLRTGCVVAGFYFIAQRDWRIFLACLLGFFLARFVTTMAVRTAKGVVHAA